MRIPLTLLHSRIVHFIVSCLILIGLSSLHPGIKSNIAPIEAASHTVLELDGTQLVQEAKDLLAETFSIPASSVTAVNCCQLIDGRYQYNCTIPINNDGFVYFTLSGGQIIVDDVEGF